MATRAPEVDLAVRLQVARERVARMEQAELAEKIGVSPGTISKWERGKSEPKLRCIRRIAEVTGAPFEWLVGVSPGDSPLPGQMRKAPALAA